MTDIENRARELLAKHYKLMCPPHMTFEDPPQAVWYEYNAAPIAALTEVLARLEEVEGNLESALIYLEEAGLSRASALIRIVEPSQAALDWAASVTQEIKE